MQAKILQNNSLLIYLLSLVFIIGNLIAIIFQFYWISLLPVVLVLILLYFYAFDKFLLFIVFTIPLSVNLIDKGFNIGMSLPAEPILFIIMLLFFIKLLLLNNYDLKITLHPVSIAIFINLFWLFITSLTSQLPIVSFKYLISRLWFTVVFYFIFVPLFKDLKNLRYFIWTYASSLLIVIAYTIINHSKYNFNEPTSHWVMTPFFNDHTAYAAIIAFLIPVFLFFCFNYKSKKIFRFFSIIFSLILLTALILSYSRAAWVSLAIALVVFLFIILKINFKIIFSGFIILISLFFIFKEDIIGKMKKNKEQSSTEFASHVRSISNITSDASNLERLNRWNSAIRMYNDNPIFGTGPGTYQFLYAPYQQYKDKTVISTNAGDRGNAHSEYIGPLAESGLPGMLSFILIAITAIYTALKNYFKSDDKEIKFLLFAVTLGLITYLVHGSLNNFLDTDKASCLFWGFIAIIVSIELYHNKNQSNTF